MTHPEVHFSEATHADLGKSPAGSISSSCTYTAIDYPCTVVEFMVCSIELFCIFCQVLKNFES